MTETKTNILRERLVTFTVSVVHLARDHERDRILAPLFNQVIRSAGSVGANITEANGSGSKAGFARYFHIALQSANETQYWLDVLAQCEVCEASRIKELQEELIQFIKILKASIRTMKSSG
jgi:four helix bundle protein